MTWTAQSTPSKDTNTDGRWPNALFSPFPPSPPSSFTTESMAHSPTDLQNHLYASFLEGSTADVALRVRGSWQATYRLHRVVLIQAGFFRPMFTAGFSESNFRSRVSRKYGPEQLDIIFDDPNITRAAFEICIARLYGGGPPIHISPSLIPTPLHPLTRSFPLPPLTPDSVPHGHHPASPRFLLSLLATAVYLSIPSIAGQALKSILNTVGPTTVIRYLNFAIGHGVGPAEEDVPEAAVGLEQVAELIKYDGANNDSASTSRARTMEIGDDEDNENRKEDPAESVYAADDGHEPSYFYGGVSNKVGEAAACWLARWGGDILSYEDTRPGLFSGASTSAADAKGTSGPVIWGRCGLNATWARALLSSDLLFVKGERERYEMAKVVLELRRQSGPSDAEEAEFDQLFTHGIYYIHMSMEDLMTISRDVSNTTGKPYVPLAHLRAALWDQSTLRHQITVGSPRDRELGVAISTADLSSLERSKVREDKSKPHYPVPSDSSERIGDSTGIEGATMDQLFTGVPQDPKRATPAPTSEHNFFGLLAERQTSTTCSSADKTGICKWTPYPPFRFSAEFWDVECLKEKTRMHSHTIWYAGSLYNAYVQVIRKKGVQLGVYLHRQSHIDPLPAFSIPHHRRGELSKTHHRGNSAPIPNLNGIPQSISLPTITAINPSTPTVNRSTTPISAHVIPGSPISQSFATNASASPVPHPPQPYRDPRPSISAYFAISCCSATGSSITRFTSGPDVFAISQSWGWKSSSLRTEEYLELGEDGLPVAEESSVSGKEVSFRATVVIGVV